MSIPHIYGMIDVQQTAVRLDDFPIPVSGILRDPLLRRKVHIDDAEALRISFIPFKIIHKSPEKISPDINSVIARLL